MAKASDILEPWRRVIRLLAGSGLPMSFWLSAVLTWQYLCNRLPTLTLPNNVTPFESLTNGHKLNLSHLHVWGCDCFVAIPDELRPKASFKRFCAIFIGYEEHCVRWCVCDLKGKYSFLNDIIFNEDLSGQLGILHTPSSPCPAVAPLPVPALCPHCNLPCTHTPAGQAYDAALRLKESCWSELGIGCPDPQLVVAGVSGGAANVDCADGGEVVAAGGMHGGAGVDVVGMYWGACVDVVDDVTCGGGVVAVIYTPPCVLADSTQTM